MTDTLSRLVERTLGLMQIAHPLILPLFANRSEVEAGPASLRNLAIGPPAVPDYEQAERTAGSPGTVLSQQLQDGTVAAASRLAPSEPNKLPTPVRSHSAAQTPRIVPAAEALDTWVENAPPGPTSGFAAQQHSLPGVGSASNAQLWEPVQPAAETPATIAAACRQLLPMQQKEPTRLFAAGTGATPNSPEPRSRSSAADPATTPPQAVHSTAQQTVGTELSDTRSSVPAAPAPVIQVSIGRIEVRAVMRQPAQSEPAAPGPKISLQEYLRTSKGGSR